MYISSIPDQKAWAVTCFIRYFLILEWNLQLHLLPFSSCSQESLNKIQMIGCMTIIIATAYPRQTGFLNLLLLFFFWQISFFFHREWTFSRNLRERSYIRGQQNCLCTLGCYQSISQTKRKNNQTHFRSSQTVHRSCIDLIVCLCLSSKFDPNRITTQQLEEYLPYILLSKQNYQSLI